MQQGRSQQPARIVDQSLWQSETAAELGEPRAGAEGNVGQHSTDRARNRSTVSQGLERIRQVSPLNTQGGSRTRESRSYGSVRGALRNERPYRDRSSRSAP
jgi:hypothetical protein